MELLMVVGIIAILASLLLAALLKAKTKTRFVSCLSNQRQIGVAYHLYADDNNDCYPVHAGWAAVGGQGRPTGPISGYATHYGSRVPTTERPLNKYVGETVEVFRCPADRGDVLNPETNTCWAGWGNSYLVEWRRDAFRVKKVTGNSTVPRDSESAIPIKQSEVALRPTTKIIQGDWPWHANRNSADSRTVWHFGSGTRYENMLFGDGHVQNYRFPKAMDGWRDSPAPDMNFDWW